MRYRATALRICMIEIECFLKFSEDYHHRVIFIEIN